VQLSLIEAATGLGVSAFAGFVANDAQTAAAVLVLLIGLKLLATDDRMYVLQAAYAFHWLETSIGLIYRLLTGREVPTFDVDYRPAVWISLGCCLALAIGIRAGLTLIKRRDDDAPRPEFAMSMGFVVSAYVVATVFESSLISLQEIYPSLRQIIVTADTARLGILFLLFRRLVWPVPRWTVIAVVLTAEIALGLTGFFAGFREPLVLAALAIMEIFDRRNVRHWAALAVAGVFATGLGMLWMSVRSEYRSNYVTLDNFEVSRQRRFENIESLSRQWLRGDSTVMWESADKLVDRMWPVYYPALAMQRVPDLIEHSHGEILLTALTHLVTPRIIFPDKPMLQSDSEKVRKYSGVMVAGLEQNTTIAFGYASEAYVDFGVPLMFLPVLVFGLIVGGLYAYFSSAIRHRDLCVAFTTVTFWTSIYLFERSWAMMLGSTLGMVVYLGLPTVLLDRVLLMREAGRRRTDASGLDPAEGASYLN
jgi:hypothetical protein